MTEIFTSGPYTCGDYDPTINPLGAFTLNLTGEEMEIYCGVRNFYGVSSALISVVGLLGNTFCLFILPRTGGAKSAIILLFTLGMYDIVFLLCTLFLKTIPSITLAGHFTVVTSNILSPAVFPLFLVAHFGAAYTTVAISIERCLAVMAPFRTRQWLTSRRIKLFENEVICFTSYKSGPFSAGKAILSGPPGCFIWLYLARQAVLSGPSSCFIWLYLARQAVLSGPSGCFIWPIKLFYLASQAVLPGPSSCFIWLYLARQAVLSGSIWPARLFYPAHQAVLSGPSSCFIWLARLFYLAHQAILSGPPGCFIWPIKLFYLALFGPPGCFIWLYLARQAVLSGQSGCFIWPIKLF
ncbi:hypothetical protein Btru_034867 [Bulinus truncatus]|nr:hypothetical protein Btru_034867 [Bulinus truncatus]